MNKSEQLAKDTVENQGQLSQALLKRKLRAIIYCRVSTDKQEQDGESLEYQEEKCRMYAELHNYEIIVVLKEAKSGFIHYSLREKLTLARQMVRDRMADAIIVWDLRRFSRNFVHSAMIFEEIESAGGEIVSVSENIDNSLTGKLIRSILAWSAESERHKIVEYANRRWQSRRELGLPVGTGRAKYGWHWKDKEKTCYTIDPEQAKVRLSIFYMYVELDMSLRQIMHKLTEDRIPTPFWYEKHPPEKATEEHEQESQPEEDIRPIWKYTTIRDILKDPENIGILVICKAKQTMSPDGKRHKEANPNRKEVPGGIPAILTDISLYERAQIKLATNQVEKSHLPFNREDFLLSGHIYCNNCNHTMKPRTQKKGRKTKGGKNKDYPFYKCTNTHNKYDSCPSLMAIPTRPLDDIVWEECCMIFQRLEVLQERIEQEVKAELTKLLEDTTGQVQMKRQERDKQAKGSYMHDLISQDIQKKEEELARYKEELGSVGSLAKATATYQKRIAEFLEFLNVMRGKYREASFQEKRNAINVLGVKVTVNDPPEVKGLSTQAQGEADGQEWFTAREAANALGVSAKTIRLYARSGKITICQESSQIRIHRDELLHLQEEGFRQRNTPEIVRERIEVTYSPILGLSPKVLNPTGVSVSFHTRR